MSRWRPGRRITHEPIGVTARRTREQMLALIHDPAQRERYLSENPESELPALPKRRGPAVNPTAPELLEGAVIAGVSAIIATHPRVLVALRMNSGMASYDAGSGRPAPVWFHKFLRYPEPLKMPDFLGWLVDGRTFALEAKRSNWKQPSDDRERKQAAFLKFVRSVGGVGAFVTDAGQVNALLAE